MSKNWKHDFVEKRIGLFAILTIVAISIGGLVEITPLLFQKQTNEPVIGLKP
ncbi:peptidase S41, partial [Pseudidiomarina aestuarii]